MTARDDGAAWLRKDWEPSASDIERVVARIEASGLDDEAKRQAIAGLRRSVRPREPGDDDDEGDQPEGEEGDLVPLGQFLKDGSDTNGTRRKRFSRLLDDDA